MKIKIFALAALVIMNLGVARSQNAGISEGLTLKTGLVNWFNLQWPPQASIPVDGSITVYVRCFEAGVTEPEGRDPRINVWIGFSEANTPPNTWTNWRSASYSAQIGTADEYQAVIGDILGAGIYYYSCRLQFNGGTYQYGGYSATGGGFWDGVNNISGVLAVGKRLATINLTNLIQPFDGQPKQVTATAFPARLPLVITYNGSTSLPVNPGSYRVLAEIQDNNYQGTQKGTFTIYSEPNDSSSIAFSKKFIWVMYDQVYRQTDLDMALSCNPDVISRGWFRWGNWGNFNYNQWAWMPQQSTGRKVMFGGGETVAVIYRDEVDPAKFQRMVDRNPLNQPILFSGDSATGAYLGDFQNQEYLDYLLGWLYKQIDAGAGTLHLDGIAEAPATGTGYSDFSIGEFNKYLISKYVGQYRWTVRDARWLSVFDISFSLDCTDGTMNTFNYRKYLSRKGFEKNPLAFVFPLRAEFGVPWNYAGTYSDQRNQTALQYLYTSVKNYGERVGKPVMVTMNGYSNYADYQTMGVWDSWSVADNKLNLTPSYIQHWRSIKVRSLQSLHREVPLIVFHDWGFGMPFFDEIPATEQILWLRVFAPEVFASGAIFAWPLSGGGNIYQPENAVTDTIKSLISWYSKNRDLYQNLKWFEEVPVDLHGEVNLVQTQFDEYAAPGDQSKRIVHLINKKVDGNRKLVVRNNLIIGVKSAKKPQSVWAVSPDYSRSQLLDYTYAGEVVDVTVKKLDAYSVIVLDYKNSGPVGIATSENTTLPVEIWPNPCQDFIRINNNPDPTLPVQIIDVQGNIVLQKVPKNNQIELTGLPAGIYIVKFRDSALRLVKVG